MNDLEESKTPPSSHPANQEEASASSAAEPKPEATPELLPERLNFGQAVEAILRNPLQLLHRMAQGDGGSAARLLLAASVFCLAVFGFFVGTFSMGEQLWAAPLKIVAGLFFATLLCLPSLYIFSNLSGLRVSYRAAGGMLLCAVCLTSLLLLSFAPIVWLFSQSTNEMAFVGPMNLFVWLIALYFGLGLIKNGAAVLGAKHAGYLRVWMAIFVLVLMQMSTSLRPIIGTSDQQFTTEKLFFLQHWFDTLDHGQPVGLQDGNRYNYD